MQYLGDYRIDDYLTFGAQLHRFSSGAVYAPTGNVVYTFYENNATAGAPTGGNLGQLNSKTGLYTARVQLTTVAGFEAGKEYLIHIEATVDLIAAAELLMFRVIDNAAIQAGCNAALVANNLDHLALTATGAADMTTEVADNTVLARILGNGDTSTFVPSTDGLHAAGVDLDAILADTTTIDTAGEIAAAVWSADATTYQDAGSFGRAIGDPLAEAAGGIYAATVTNAAGLDIAADIIAVKADTAAILLDTATIDTAGEIAAAVWSADATTYQTQGTFGQAIGDPVADTNTIFKATVTDATADTVGLDVASTLAAVQGIGTAGGAAINVDANDDNYDGDTSCTIANVNAAVKVGTQTGGFANTSILDGAYSVMAHAAQVVDILWQFLIGGGTTPIACVWTGVLNPNSDSATISAWNHVGAAWETIGSIAGQSSTTANIVKNLVLYPRHAGTSAAELGKVYIRVNSSAAYSHSLKTDQIYVTYAVTSRTVGYADGSVWVDTLAGTAGTESYVNGTADKPCLTWASALTVAAAVGLSRFTIVSGSSITLTAAFTHKWMSGEAYNLALGGQSLEGSYIHGAYVTGSGTSTGHDITFDFCRLDGVTTGQCQAESCRLNGTITLSAADSYTFVGCGPQHSNATPTIDFGAAVGASAVSFRAWAGSIILANMVDAGDYCTVGGWGKVTLAASCTAGTVNIRGNLELVNSGSGQTIVDTSRFNEDQDFTLGGALALTTGTVLTSGGVNTASAFYTNLSGGDNFWKDCLILLTSGVLAGQVKEIGGFADTDGVVTLTSGQAFTATPADGVTFDVINR